MKNSYKKTGLLTTLLTAGAMLIQKISSSLSINIVFTKMKSIVITYFS